MDLIYDDFTLICNERFTHYIPKESKNGMFKSSEETGIYLQSENKVKSFNCNLEELNIILKETTLKNEAEINLLINEFKENKNASKENISDIEKINKRINKYLSNTINGKYLILTSIECVNINKLIYIHENKKIENKKYYIFGYSILKDSKVINSDFLVLDSLHEKNINEIIKKMLYEIEWIEKEKIEVRNEEIRKFIFKNTATGIFFHECIGHFLEADFYNGSPIKLLKDKKILPDSITIYENYDINIDVDDFGNDVSKRILLIENGYIRNILSNHMYSYLLDIKNSGNEVNEKINLYNSPRMRSMYLKPDTHDLQSLLLDMNSAIMIDEMSMGEVDVYSGEFSILISKAYLIKAGKIVSPLKEFVLSYNIKELKDMKMTICNDMNVKSSLCGKGPSVVKLDYCTPSILMEV